MYQQQQRRKPVDKAVWGTGVGCAVIVLILAQVGRGMRERSEAVDRAITGPSVPSSPGYQSVYDLPVGGTYRVSGPASIMPYLDPPGDAQAIVAAAAAAKTLPEGGCFTIAGRGTNSSGDTWYQVNSDVGPGWVNPVCLLSGVTRVH